MSTEAEKVINLSLCKMAESRTVRRGNSLHKHLLITSVLTKARSVYFENWYLGDNDCSSVNSGANNDQISLNQVLDPSFFVEVEGEIELPSDILNCVEKLGEMSEMHLGFSVSSDVDLNARIQVEEEMLSEGDNEVTSSTDITRSHEELPKPRAGPEMTYTYLDLDSSKETPMSQSEEPANTNALPLLSTLPQSPINYQTSTKRRRGWSFELEDDSDDEDEEKSCSASPDLKDKLKLQSRGHAAKRLRSSNFSISAESSEIFGSGFSCTSSPPLPVLSFSSEGNNFRTKKAHFDVDEEEDSSSSGTIDAFLDDDDDSWCSNSMKVKTPEKHDRRVPSASSSCSSDEEQEASSMEVDQITSLVQYFSFQKPHQVNSAPASMSASSQAQLSSLSRSMSSPDLCGRSGGGNGSSNSGNSVLCPKSKDLFSSYGLTSSHRVLTMKV